MRLYHGSNVRIDNIDLLMSKCGKDFGVGFYLSADPEQAAKMAKIAVIRNGCGTPTVSEFEFDETKIATNCLSVKNFDGYTVEWAEFILKNRMNTARKQTHQFDIVIGPIANDTVGVQLRRFIEHYINIEQLVEELKFIRPTVQYFFANEQALGALSGVAS